MLQKEIARLQKHKIMASDLAEQDKNNSNIITHTNMEGRIKIL